MRPRFFLYLFFSIVLAVFFFYPGILQRWRSRFFYNPDDSFVHEVMRENDVLRSSLAQKTAASNRLSTFNNFSVVPAFVYSRFPFNFREEISVAVGARDNIAVGDVIVLPVSDQGAILFGSTIAVSQTVSHAMTIFDALWKSPVRIGSSGVQGLLVGGLSPRITFISRTADVSVGDIIYNADSRFPFGLTIGQIKRIESSADSGFRQADIKFSYDPSDIFVVGVLRTHDDR
jgi:cell shape-determining protein MreC